MHQVQEVALHDSPFTAPVSCFVWEWELCTFPGRWGGREERESRCRRTLPREAPKPPGTCEDDSFLYTVHAFWSVNILFGKAPWFVWWAHPDGLTAGHRGSERSARAVPEWQGLASPKHSDERSFQSSISNEIKPQSSFTAPILIRDRLRPPVTGNLISILTGYLNPLKQRLKAKVNWETQHVCKVSSFLCPLRLEWNPATIGPLVPF